jgi:hypothetical protein
MGLPVWEARVLEQEVVRRDDKELHEGLLIDMLGEIWKARPREYKQAC